jgi:hypothetical protein
MIQVNFTRLLHSPTGRIIISVVLGLGLASLFHKVCKDKDCIKFQGPVIKEIDGKTFEYDHKCFQYQAVPVPCNAEKRTLTFAHTNPFEKTTTTGFGSMMGSSSD